MLRGETIEESDVGSDFRNASAVKLPCYRKHMVARLSAMSLPFLPLHTSFFSLHFIGNFNKKKIKKTHFSSFSCVVFVFCILISNVIVFQFGVYDYLVNFCPRKIKLACLPCFFFFLLPNHAVYLVARIFTRV